MARSASEPSPGRTSINFWSQRAKAKAAYTGGGREPVVEEEEGGVTP